jgi:hypothetical protein
MSLHRLVALQLFAALTLWGCSCFAPVKEARCDEATPCGSGWVCIGGECFPPGSGGGGQAAGGGAPGGGAGGGVGGAGGGMAPCGPNTCTGCCASNGQCLAGTANATCGGKGQTCGLCTAGQTCRDQACVAVPVCNAMTCSNGCCWGGTCLPFSSQTSGSCGVGGGSCTPCATGDTCAFGKCGMGNPCNSGSCLGCCAGQVCIPTSIQTSNLCGAQASTCQSCGAGKLCSNGVCGSPTTCNASNCAGCCESGKCLLPTMQTAALCGVSGNACKSCPSGTTCGGGVCTAMPCGPQNCAGCCGQGQNCLGGTSASACGIGGKVCQTCASGQVCGGAACISVPFPKFGDPCGSNGDCAGAGLGAYCRKITTSGALYQGGFCTRNCTTDAGVSIGCSASSVCLDTLGSYGEQATVCSPVCSVNNPCRANGYSCYAWPSLAVSACWLDPLPGSTADAGTALSIGQSCVNDAQCLNPANSFCLPDVLPGVGATGFVGGYCTTSCNGAACATDSRCVGVSNNLGVTLPLCLRACANPRSGQSSCRNGYICETSGTTGGGYCLPKCNNAGSSCPLGTACNAMTGYCN